LISNIALSKATFVKQEHESNLQMNKEQNAVIRKADIVLNGSGITILSSLRHVLLKPSVAGLRRISNNVIINK